MLGLPPPEVVIPLDGTQQYRRSIKEALEVLQEKQDYEDARQRFLELHAQAESDEMQDFLEGMVTATWYGAKEHRKGLDYICEAYRAKPRDNVRHRFRIHAHVRQVAIDEGFQAARQLVSEMRMRCRRSDFSYVWAGIPLAKAEYLREGFTVFEEHYKLSTADEDYLRKVIDRYPDDAFLDHAFYFLGEFEHVIQTFKDSLIIDVVYRAAGQVALRKGNAEKAIAYLRTALKRWPDSHPREVVAGLQEAYRRTGDLDSILDLEETHGLVNADPVLTLIGQKRPMRTAAEVRKVLETLSRRRRLEKLARLFEPDCPKYFSIANRALWKQDYKQALEEYSAVQQVFGELGIAAPSCISGSKKLLEKLVTNFAGEAVHDLLQSGITLRRAGGGGWPRGEQATKGLLHPAFKSAAVLAWKRCTNLAAKEPEKHPNGEKCLYLAAAAERRMHNYSSSDTLFRQLVRLYPKGDLADDALTELGWYQLYIEEDHEAAQRYFDQVLAKFPDRNAADNALDWKAQSYFIQGLYKKALKTYKQIVDDYSEYSSGHGRLAHEVAPYEIDFLQPVVDSVKERNFIPGIVFDPDAELEGGAYVAEVEPKTEVAKKGLQGGDIIVSVNGKEVKSIEGFQQELMRLRKRSSVTIRAIRDEETELTITVRMGVEEYYEVEPGQVELDEE